MSEQIEIVCFGGPLDGWGRSIDKATLGTRRMVRDFCGLEGDYYILPVCNPSGEYPAIHSPLIERLLRHLGFDAPKAPDEPIP